MTRILTLLAVTAMCATLSAQSFPHLEKKKVKSAVGAAAKTDKPDETKPEVVKAGDVDGAAVLAKYDELLAAFFTDKKGQKAMFEVNTKGVVESLRDYLEGQALLRLGFYKDAKKKFDDVGHTVKGYDELRNSSQENIADEIQGGKAYYFKIVATVMEHYEYFETAEELDSSWKKADRDAAKIVKDLRKQVKRKRIEETVGEQMLVEINNWLLQQKGNWRVLWAAERACKNNPENINSWLMLVGCTGSNGTGRLKEKTPAYLLKQRAALDVIKKFWVTNNFVMAGQADELYGYNHLGALQFDEASNALKEKSYHTRAGKGKLRFARKRVNGFIRSAETLLK